MSIDIVLCVVLYVAFALLVGLSSISSATEGLHRLTGYLTFPAQTWFSDTARAWSFPISFMLENLKFSQRTMMVWYLLLTLCVLPVRLLWAIAVFAMMIFFYFPFILFTETF